jgi:hypothetical protein
MARARQGAGGVIVMPTASAAPATVLGGIAESSSCAVG